MIILIVDDHPTNRKLLRAQLETASHQVVEAADGAEALQILEREPVDAVVSDILMPNMDGFALCQKIRQTEKFASLPFVVYTSTYTSPADERLARTVGADQYLTKPASTEAILSALQMARLESSQRTKRLSSSEDEVLVLKQYNAALVSKLEEKNAELTGALEKLQRAHDRIVELNSDLEKRVKSRTAELSEANEQLKRRNSEIENFYHTLSHELKTPLTSAREFVALMMDGVGGAINQTQKEYLMYAQESCDQMHRCLNDLLDASRLDTGKLSLELSRGPLGPVLERVLKSLEGAILAKQIRLQKEVPAGLPNTAFDDYRITQVLTNLINNALKFTPKGGWIRVELGPAEEPQFLQLTVADNGRGIPPEDQSKIFDRLYQVQEGDATTTHGMGLGLYLCRELVSMHGGKIWVRSKPGEGSTFTFTLPIVPAV